MTQKVFVANFGYKNVHWKTCLDENVLTLQASQEVFDFWTKGEKEQWLDWACANEKLMNGSAATRPVASRWYNLLNLFHDTQNDLWLHREGGDLYWTVALAGDVTHIPIADPFGGKRPHILFKRAAEKWTNRDKEGRRLQWKALHPKSHDFLMTEATYQELADDRGYRNYAINLIEGASLESWHRQPEWARKQGSKGTVRIFSNLEKTIFDAIYRVKNTVLRADGRTVERVLKQKELRVSEEEMREFLHMLYREQEGLCALTGLRTAQPAEPPKWGETLCLASGPRRQRSLAQDPRDRSKLRKAAAELPAHDATQPADRRRLLHGELGR